MKLATKQLDLISKEIITGGIKYQDLYEELLDHYITAIEDRMSQGKSFEEAFGEVHADFVNYKRPAHIWDHYNVWKDYNGGASEYGLRKLQAEYEESLSGEINKRHWQIIKGYFRWPTIVTTLLVGLITFQFAYLMPRQYFIWIIFTCAFAPVFLLLPQSILDSRLYFLKRRKFINSLKINTITGRMFLSISLFSLFINITNISNYFFEYNLLKQNFVTITTILTCFYLAYSLSFYQLYRERFKVNRA